MAIASGIVSALAVSLLIRIDQGYLDSLDNKIEFCRVLAESVKGIEDGDFYKTRNTGQVDSLYNRLENTIPEFLKENISPEEADKILFSGAYVLESQPIALYSFLLTPGDFRQSLLSSVNYSHDSDTVGAIACALSGAYNTDVVIEAKYLNTLEHRDHLMAMACDFGQI
jgi:ADP-ribosylglycohydrolase